MAGGSWLPRRHRARPSAALDGPTMVVDKRTPRQRTPRRPWSQGRSGIGDDRKVRMNGTRRFHHSEFEGAQLAGAKAGRVISVCLPARDEEKTVGTIVRLVRQSLTAEGGGVDLVDEVLV